MSKPSRAQVCRIVAVMASGKAMTADDLAAAADVGIDPARKWIHAMHAADLVRPDGAEPSRHHGPARMLWRWRA